MENQVTASLAVSTVFLWRSRANLSLSWVLGRHLRLWLCCRAGTSVASSLEQVVNMVSFVLPVQTFQSISGSVGKTWKRMNRPGVLGNTVFFHSLWLKCGRFFHPSLCSFYLGHTTTFDSLSLCLGFPDWVSLFVVGFVCFAIKLSFQLRMMLTVSCNWWYLHMFLL